MTEVSDGVGKQNGEGKRSVLRRVRRYIGDQLRYWLPQETQFHDMSNQQIFEKIYKERLWGDATDGGKLYSGSGSHIPTVVDGYVSAVKEFVSKAGHAMTAADIGCGDFNVGARLTDSFKYYTACDIVPFVIEEHKKHFVRDNLEFRVLDLVRDELPSADVILVRQVLQHLSNADIASFLQKLPGKCTHFILTEHVPFARRFKANIDKPSGARTRTAIRSGVDVTKPPFNLEAMEQLKLCEFEDPHGMIRTIAYTLPV